VVAVVGRPNVGKSSLVNRVLGRREAIVEASPGVTRDRHGFLADWGGRSFEIVDTGGLEAGAGGLGERVQEQAQLAIETADVVVLVVDAQSGPLEDDMIVARDLRKSSKPVVVVANKVDEPSETAAAAPFHKLGLGEPFPVSALHGTGSGDLLDALVERLPDVTGAAGDAWGSIAIVGRPNVGKSSILNALLGSDRSIVDPEPGTTRDPVDSYVSLDDGRRLRIVDTAGIRKQVRIEDPIEYFSLLRSRRTLGRADAVLLVVDASVGVTSHDQRIAQEVVEQGRACTIALNKWDLVSRDESDRARLQRDIKQKLRFAPWARTVRTSALTGRGLNALLPALKDAIDSHRRRLPTAEVNRIVRRAQDERPHPRTGGRTVRILYAVQARVAPPTVLMFATGALEPAYQRYLERRIRDAEPFEGTPVTVSYRLKRRGELEG
jgi:GTPase